MNRTILSLLILFFTSVVQAQNFSGKVVDILATNAFVVERTSGDSLKVALQDTAPIESAEKQKLALAYLRQKIHGKNVLVVPSDKITERGEIEVSILYNCEQIEGVNYENEEIPCSRGNVLDVEMIKEGLLRYIGDNAFLKKLSPY